MSKLFKFVFIVFCFFSMGFSFGEKIIEAKVDKKNVETGEIFTYEVTIRENLDITALKLPEFKGFKIVSQSQSQSYSAKGGVSRTIINLTYLLFAPEPGSFTIKPVTLESKEQKYQTQAITIEVKGESLEKKRKILPYIKKGTNL